ncbi:Fe-S cluster assembly protein SufD [Aquamicrobium sp. LC103]|uniref:Fe-S cluster assembly protein SufD n=1 Tax=Aquamicrobium sp. LC103 TaxID=1120658 RepID=UPI00063E8B36|nr:Fe-S cluster assembly protein SufD [Aquamicrobium sp. LC103]TKT79222.1 Fe-S cluster assembly protein SufD [Aquamicrobium sp. LC103]
MNIHAGQTLTPAENALVEAFAERLSDLPGDAEVTTRRDDAIEALKIGLPTRRIEAWHYTDLRRLLNSVPAFDPAAKPQAVRPLLEGSALYRVLNGVAEKAPTLEGVASELFRDRLLAGDPGKAFAIEDDADAIGTVNVAFVSDGHTLTIADGAEIEAPIELQNVQAGGQAHTRFAVSAGAGSKAVIVERQTGSGDALVSSVSELEVGDGAEIVWLILQEQPKGATQLGQIKVTIGKDAKLTLFLMNAGGKLVRQEVRVVAAGEGSDFKLRGANLLGGETHCDVTMVLDHAAPDTTSTEVIRNVVLDKARGVFQGQIRVAAIAQKTDAKMACNTLLLSDDGEFSTKPELEIFADDVACGHGATVTEINHDHLFYLMARGVEEKLARGLLVKAFLAEVIEELEEENIVEALEEKLTQWFAAHG